MKHDDELKNKNEQSRKLEEIKEAQAGMLLTDDEVSEVAGGMGYDSKRPIPPGPREPSVGCP